MQGIFDGLGDTATLIRYTGSAMAGVGLANNVFQIYDILVNQGKNVLFDGGEVPLPS